MQLRHRYRRSPSAFEQLDPETERSLAAAAREGDADAWQKLVMTCLPCVLRVAREYRLWGVPVEDLVQQGNLGLLRAAGRYDPDRGRLATYATYWIRAEIRDYVMRQHRITRIGTTKSERRAVRAWRVRGTDAIDELVSDSGMPRERAARLLAILGEGDVSMDFPHGGLPPLVERMGDDAPTPEEHLHDAVAREHLRRAVTDALDGLSPRERRIARQRLMSDDPMTLEQLGREMGVTKERVRQIEVRVREKLREELARLRAVA